MANCQCQDRPEESTPRGSSSLQPPLALGQGDVGEGRIMATQEVHATLRELGWPIDVDGQVWDRREEAVSDFERGFASCHLPDDGVADFQTPEARRCCLDSGAGCCRELFPFAEFHSERKRLDQCTGSWWEARPVPAARNHRLPRPPTTSKGGRGGDKPASLWQRRRHRIGRLCQRRATSGCPAGSAPRRLGTPPPR